MDVNEKLLKLEQMNTALTEALLSNDYEKQYDLLKAYSEMGEKDG